MGDCFFFLRGVPSQRLGLRDRTGEGGDERGWGTCEGGGRERLVLFYKEFDIFLTNITEFGEFILKFAALYWSLTEVDITIYLFSII